MFIEMFATELEVTSEIFFTHHRIGSQFLACALIEYFTLKQQIGAVGDTESLVGVMVGDENAYVLSFSL